MIESNKTTNISVTIPDGGVGALLAGRYRVIRQLGQGGMGSVWLAEDTQLDNKLFAIKMLPSILVSNKRAYRQLKDEALVAMKLTHPNIVTLRAFEENDGNPFLVMDYVDGVTLDDYLAEHGGGNLTQSRREAESQRSLGNGCGCGISEAEVVRILKPIAAALDYAHKKGVVHRDVKPGNVMIAKDGTPYILDFGIAREVQETMTRVTGKLSSGTLLYMSPEQLRGMKPQPGQDIYSFAAMAYECLKGEPPFSRGQIEYQILNEQPETLRSDGVLAIGIMAGLAKKPEDRPATCAAVLEGDGAARVEPVEHAESRKWVEPRVAVVPQVTDTCTPSTWKIPIASHEVKFMWTSWWGILAELMVLTCVAGWFLGLMVMTGIPIIPMMGSIDDNAQDWNLAWIVFTMAIEVISVIVYFARHAIWQHVMKKLVPEKSWLFKKIMRRGVRKILVIANFAWIICLPLVLDYSESYLYEIDGAKYSNDMKLYADHIRYDGHRIYDTRDLVFVRKESGSSWIVKRDDYYRKAAKPAADGKAAKPAADAEFHSKPTDNPNVENDESRDKSMDDCFRLKVNFGFENYIVGFLSLLSSVLCLWIPKSLVAFIKYRTQSVLQAFDATNWYNARRRIFYAFQNDPYMRFYRGVCALEGLGGRPRDMGFAQELFRKAANQGMLEAFCALGYMSQHGIGCEVNLTEARGYYSEARNLGCELAAKLLEDLNKAR